MVKRPWGHYEVLATGPGYKVKRLTIMPGKRTSLQKHKHRNEYWIVASGKTRGLQFSVPQGAVHRISNTQDKPIVYIEVQTGDKLLESDIIRLKDDYGRAK